MRCQLLRAQCDSAAVIDTMCCRPAEVCSQLTEEEEKKQVELQGLLATVAAARHEQQSLNRQLAKLKHEQSAFAQVSARPSKSTILPVNDNLKTHLPRSRSVRVMLELSGAALPHQAMRCFSETFILNARHVT